jgi:hypothetical protein
MRMSPTRRDSHHGADADASSMGNAEGGTRRDLSRRELAGRPGELCLR